MNDRILIAGTNSGCGKTTITCALLAALKCRGMDIASFKCGPDYIDPMFHRVALGIPAHNLDPFFSTEEQLRNQLADSGHALSVIEGVMGYYDGIGTHGRASTYDVARATETPVILVVDIRGMHTSAGALMQGFRVFRPNSWIRGVIFNNASPMLYEGLQKLAREADVTALGFLPYEKPLSIGSRHLGLITAGGIADIGEKLDSLGALAEKHLDIDGILRMAAAASPLNTASSENSLVSNVRIAVARDEAFCFIYQENLELLFALGAQLCFFSPLHDAALPENVQGLYLPGGYPELHVAELADNKTMRAAVKSAVANGLPTVAECGGFLYLHDTLDGLPMAGAIPGAAYRTDQLQRFGYVTLTAQRDNLLCRAGESIRAHEFHYYDSQSCGDGFRGERASGGNAYACVHATGTLYAGFPHLYLPANSAFAESFLRRAAAYTPPPKVAGGAGC